MRIDCSDYHYYELVDKSEVAVKSSADEAAFIVTHRFWGGGIEKVLELIGEGPAQVNSFFTQLFENLSLGGESGRVRSKDISGIG
jgi:hypothetical protein